MLFLPSLTIANSDVNVYVYVNFARVMDGSICLQLTDVNLICGGLFVDFYSKR